jgi:hypothetical protein
VPSASQQLCVVLLVSTAGRHFSEKVGVKEKGRGESIASPRPHPLPLPLPHQATLLQKSGVFHGATSTQERMSVYSAAVCTFALV